MIDCLYPFQKAGVKYALEHNYTINGCEMGLGKTIQALAVMEQLKCRTLIVCPAYLAINWEYEIDRFLPGYDKSLISITSYYKFTRDAIDYVDCKLVIFDEAHYLKNMNSQRAKVAHSFIYRSAPTHLMLLTGTPIMNRVTEFYSLLKLCSFNPLKTNGEKITRGFAQFCNVLCYNHRIPSSSGFLIKKWYGLKNEPVLRKYLKFKYFRKLAKDELDLPKIIHKYIYTEVKPSKTDCDELEAAFEDKNLAHISVAKAKSALFKTPTTLKYVNDLLDQGEKPLLIFTDHVAAAKELHFKLQLKNTAVIIDGSVTSMKRNQTVEDFNKSKVDVIIATIGSMSTGFNLTASRHVIFNDLSWVPASNLQCEKRIHRIGQTQQCLVVKILCSKIDYLIQKHLDEKMEVLRNAT
tara:strand:+ start:1001 stop:2224 length:1224 start_codon:yes stop_codon:yes gene_type:complete